MDLFDDASDDLDGYHAAGEGGDGLGDGGSRMRVEV